MNRPEPFWRGVLVALAAAAGLAAQERVLVMPGQDGGGVVTSYSASLTDPETLGTAAGAYMALSDALGDRLFFISKKDTAYRLSILDAGGTAVSGTPVTIGSPVKTFALTPDGTRLLVVANTLLIYDPNASGAFTPLSATTGSNPVDVASSLDSKVAYVLSAADRRVYAVDLATRNISGTLTLARTPNALAMGPNGYLYASADQAVYEIDPIGVTVRRTFTLPEGASPGKARFTPDGVNLIATDRTGAQKAAVVIQLPTAKITTIPTLGTPLTSLVVPDGSKAYAVTGAGKVYSINLLTGAFGEASFAPTGPFDSGTRFSGAQALAVSNELPRATYLYVLAGSPLKLTPVNLIANTIGDAVEASGAVAFVSSASSEPVASLLAVNQNQVLGAGARTQPLIVRALDAAGHPVASAEVLWANAPEAVSVMPGTNNEGYAQAVFTTPDTPGFLRVTAVVGNQSKEFTLDTRSGSGGGGGGAAGSPGVLVVAGQGSITTVAPYGVVEPIVVEIRDEGGSLMPNEQVTFSLAQNIPTAFGAAVGFLLAGDGQSCTVVSTEKLVCTTDANARASVKVVAQRLQPDVPFVQYTVTAAVASGSVTIYQSFTHPTDRGQAVQPIATIFLNQATYTTLKDGTLTARVGTTLPGVFRVFFATLLENAKIPNAGVKITTTGPAGGPIVNCAGGTALSDKDGYATCDLVIAGKPGEVKVNINLADSLQKDAYFSLVVLPPLITQIAKISTDNQMGKAGEKFTLTAELRDATSAAIPNASATWEVLTGADLATATVNPASAKSDANGRVSTSVTLGSTAGPVWVKVKADNAEQTFSLYVVPNVSSLRAANGSGQNAIEGQRFAEQVVVEALDAQSHPVAKAPVTFKVSSGTGTATVPSDFVITDAQGRAGVTVTAGRYGTVVVSATVPGVQTPATFNLTVRPTGPALEPASFMNGASFVVGNGVAPGEIITIFGAGLLSGADLGGNCAIGGDAASPLATRVAGVEVSFGERLAPIYSVCRNEGGGEQVSVQVPWGLSLSSDTEVTFRTGIDTLLEASTEVGEIHVVEASPGIFEYTEGNQRMAVAMKLSDGTYTSPANPAVRGEKVRIFATGLGPVVPPTDTNQPGVEGQQLDGNTASVTIGGTAAADVETRYAQNTIGIYTLDFTVPDTITGADAVELAIKLTTADNRVFAGTKTSLIPVRTQ